MSVDPTPRPPTVLVVEDTPEFQFVLQSALDDAGFRVLIAESGELALDQCRRYEPEVILLDIVLPGIDGFEVCRRLRSFSDAHVIMLTTRDSEADKVAGLMVGADDFVTKPFSAPELLARIRARLRRPAVMSAQPEPERLVRTHGELCVDSDTRQVWVGSDEVDLTRIEFDLLETLIERPGTVRSIDLLLEVVWGECWSRDERVVQVHMSNLRRKIDRDGASHVKTVRGVGYRLAAARDGSASPAAAVSAR